MACSHGSNLNFWFEMYLGFDPNLSDFCVVDHEGNYVLQSTTTTTSADPTTAEPTTSEPTTADPTTADPTTADPTTADPTTADPTTADPTSAEPTTANPSTAQPSVPFGEAEAAGTTAGTMATADSDPLIQMRAESFPQWTVLMGCVLVAIICVLMVCGVCFCRKLKLEKREVDDNMDTMQQNMDANEGNPPIRTIWVKWMKRMILRIW
eukprot:404470_1